MKRAQAGALSRARLGCSQLLAAVISPIVPFRRSFIHLYFFFI
jgi:hypothetical protein